MTGAGVETLVDTARYPLDRPDDPNWVDLLARGRAELAAAGSFNLDGFLHEEAISRAVAEIEAGLARCAHHHLAEPNIYFSDEENGGAATAKTPPLLQLDARGRSAARWRAGPGLSMAGPSDVPRRAL